MTRKETPDEHYPVGPCSALKTCGDSTHKSRWAGEDLPSRHPLSSCIKVHMHPCPAEHFRHWVCLCGGVRKNGASVTMSPLGGQTVELGWGCTCTLGTTRCLESWVLLSMRLFQSSKSTVLREKTRQQSRLPEIVGPSTQLYPQALGCLGVLNTLAIPQKTVPKLSLHELP